MPVQPIVRSIVRPTVTGIVRSFGSSFVSRFGAGLSAAYFLADLGSKRGTVDSATNPVSRVLRDSDGGLRAFTAGDIKSGTALDYVNNGTTGLYGNAMYFDGVNDKVELGTNIIGNVINPFKITAKFISIEGGRNLSVYQESDGTGDLWLRVEGTTQARALLGDSSEIGAQTLVAVSGNFSDGEEHTVVLEHTGSSLILTIDGVNTNSASTTALTSLATGGNSQIGIVSGVSAKGVIRDVQIEVSGSLVSSYVGNGNTNASWEDQTGSNDGTVDGSPALYTGQMFGGVQAKFYDGLASANDATQATVADMPKTVVAGALVVDGNGNASTLWDGTDELTFTAAFTGLTSANVYAVTDNAGTVTLDTLTSFNISSITTMTALLTSLTYTKVTAVVIAPDATNQSDIQAELNRIFRI